MAGRESVAEISAHDQLCHDDGEPESATAQLAEVVVEAAAALSGKFQPQALREIIAEQAARSLNADLSLLYGAAVEHHARPIRLVASSNLPSAFAAQLADLTGTSSLVLRAAESRRIEHAVVDQAACERFSDLSALAASTRPHWVLSAPLLSADRLFGVLFCAFGSRSASFQESPARACRPSARCSRSRSRAPSPPRARERARGRRLRTGRGRAGAHRSCFARGRVAPRGGAAMAAQRDRRLPRRHRRPGRARRRCSSRAAAARSSAAGRTRSQALEIGPCALLCEPGGRPLLLPEMPSFARRVARGRRVRSCGFEGRTGATSPSW